MFPLPHIPLFKVNIPQNLAHDLEHIFESGYLADGQAVRNFERSLQEFVKNPFLLTTSDISGSITLALKLAGVQAGDEVIVSPMCCTASTMPIANLQAKPIWCDVRPETGMMNPELLPELLTSKTKAIIVYHWSGDIAEMENILQFARSHGIIVIEDASEAFGAEILGTKIGSIGADFTAFSFHAIKHITTGEGGALSCAREEDFLRAQKLKRYGINQQTFRTHLGFINEKSDIPEAGFNFYMNNIAGAIGSRQMESVNTYLMRYRENGVFFDQRLQECENIQLLMRRQDAISAYWTYTFRVQNREELATKLRQKGIACQPLHVRNDIYSCFDTSRHRKLPGTDVFNAETLSIPCGWWVTDEMREEIISEILKNQ